MAKKAKNISQVLSKIADDLQKNAEIIAQETVSELVEIFKEDIKDMMNDAADAFYADYDPHMYIRHKRKPTLANMYRVNVDHEIYVELGGEFSSNKHRVSNDYIYEKMFKEGWHGGSTDNKNPETLYYSRWHGDHWEPFVYEAKRMQNDMSPYQIFIENYNNYLLKDFPLIVKKTVKDNMMKLFYGRK